MAELASSRDTTVLAVVLLFGGGMAVGRYSTPTRVEEKVRVEKVEVEKQVVAVQETVRVEKVYLASESQRIHREEHTVEHPNGLKETHKSEDINTEKVVKEHAIQYVDREVVKYVEHTRVETKEVEKIVEADRPDWRANLMVATVVPIFELESSAPYIDPLLFGGEVQRRVIGPVWAGGFALSNGTVGLSVGAEW